MPQRRTGRASSGLPAADWLTPVLLALFVAGYFATRAFVRHLPAARTFASGPAEFGLWTVFMGLVGGSALAASAYFGRWLITARRRWGSATRGAVLISTTVVLLVLGTVLATLFGGGGDLSPLDADLARQTRPATVLIGLALTPGLVGFLVVRRIARADRDWAGADDANLRQVIGLRGDLRRLLGVLGAVLTLLVLTAGVRRTALLAHDPRLHLPPEAVLLYGATFAVLLGGFFAAANSALDARAGALLDGFAPLPDPRDPQSSDVIRRRSDLAALLGLDSSRRTFESTVVVAAPLLSALLAGGIGS